MSVADDYQIEVLTRTAQDHRDINAMAFAVTSAIFASRAAVSKELSDFLTEHSGDEALGRSGALLSSVAAIRKQAIVDAFSAFKDEMIRLSGDESRWALYSMSSLLSLDVPVFVRDTITGNVFEQTVIRGRVISDWIDGIVEAEMRRISDALRIGLMEERRYNEILTGIAGTAKQKYRDGVLRLSERDSEALAVTAGTVIVESTREESWSAFSQFSALRWNSILDSRTSEGCINLNGKIVLLPGRDAPPLGNLQLVYPPNIRPGYHWRCRSTLVPIFLIDGELVVPKDISLADFEAAQQ